jgi:hypothetical protein
MSASERVLSCPRCGGALRVNDGQPIRVNEREVEAFCAAPCSVSFDAVRCDDGGWIVREIDEEVPIVVVIAPEPRDVCEKCGKLDELRPYGANGERICFDCGQLDRPTTERQMRRRLFGEPS